MSQERPLCRFCLDSKNELKNPLVEPCECRGSLRYVHQLCLSRWQRLNPARNGDMCMLCLQPYHDDFNESLEIIPEKNTLSSFLLRFPFMICLVTNYVGVFHYSILPFKSDYTLFYRYYQFLFEACFFLLFVTQWRVRNRPLYWKEWKAKQIHLWLFLHAVCNYYIYHGELWVTLPLNYILYFYWATHIQILEKINN